MCPSGTFALGGGGSAAAGAYLASSTPILDTSGRAIGWIVAQNSGGTTALSSYVICADVVAAGTPPSGAPLSATPPFTANEDNTVSTTVPGNGQHSYTFQANGLTGTLAFAVISSGKS